MPATHAGQLLLVVTGLPYIHVKSVNKTLRTNRERVTGMSPTGTPIGFVEGTKEVSLTVEAYIPRTGDIPWETITAGIITTANRDGGSPSVLYTGCYVTQVGERYNEKGAAIRTIEMDALMAEGL